jgi:CspA family cold shock protein
MKSGIVKFFNETKGFGFIKDENSSEEVFVHASGLQDQIKQDDRVLYEVQTGKKGLNAVNVKLA